MKRLGISLYPQHSDMETMQKYILTAAKHGFDRIFTCFMSIKDEEEMSKMKSIQLFAKENGFDISADIAPTVLEEMNLTYREIHQLKEQFHLSAIRLDMGFSGQEEAFMSVDDSGLAIELNISNGTKYLANILSYEANKDRLLGCHNFYPKKYTGLSREHFLETSKLFKKQGVRTAAMISSHNAQFGPWEETPYGLPTLEEHRHLPITVQAKDLWHTQLIDDLIIGNMYASEEELEALGQLNRSTLSLKVELNNGISQLEQKIIFEEKHFNRGDVSAYVIRSTQPRVKYKDESVPPLKPQTLMPGDLTIDNDLDIRYKGELNLVLKEMPNEGKTNVVGKVVENEQFLVHHIRPWETFSFTKK